MADDGSDFAVGDKVCVKYKYFKKGGWTSIEYEKAKIVDKDDENRYLIHYIGWNKRYDEWVPRRKMVDYNVGIKIPVKLNPPNKC